MKNDLSEVAKVSALTATSKWYLEEAEDYFKGSPTVGKESVKQLTMGAIVAATAALENSGTPMTWANVDARKFASELFRMIGYGLDFGNKEVYVIPYKNNKTGKVELTTPISADGLVKLAKLYAIGRKIVDFKRFYVREGDEFSYWETSSGGTEWEYKPKMFNENKVRGFVTIIVYEDGKSDVLITTHEDVAKRRAVSKASNSPAWTKFPNEMGMAKAVRRHMKKVDIALPQEFADEDFEPITEDMGDIVSPKVEVDYPALVKQTEIEEEEEQGDAWESDDDIFKGTPMEDMK
jgi:recombinational DNA repair protein RecT